MKILHNVNMAYISRKLSIIILVLSFIPIFNITYALEPQCAQVKIVIEQKLSFERQAFDARMVINNGLASASLQNVNIELLFLDKQSQSVVATQDPNATGAKFFYKTDSLSGIDSIAGSGTVTPKSSAEIHWLIIPSAGAATQESTLYYVGAKVTYSLNGKTSTVEVTPDYIMVKPLPMLTLDYFFPKDVYADDPFTPQVEAPVPFTLGVRIKNTGFGSSTKTVIESAQPKIIENKQGLLIAFNILGGFVSDEPVGKSLLLDFGEIGAASSKVGRWNMVTSLAGKFVDFTATYSHADGLGGALTSLIKEVNTHTLVHDVRVDLPGRDNVRDFLARDKDMLRVYESEGLDSAVTEQSTNAKSKMLNGLLQITFPTTSGFVYVQIKDPFGGAKNPANVQRSDGKSLPIENVWLSKTQNDDLSWSHFINLFDNASTGVYSLSFTEGINASVSGMVYDDADGNGLVSKGESGIGAVAVTLKGLDDNGVSVTIVAYTDPAGIFTFSDLTPGNYSLEVAAISGMIDGAAFSGAAGGLATSGKITDMRLTGGTHAEGNIFAKRSSGIEENIRGNADLSVALTTSSNTPALGSNLTLNVTIKNLGPDAAINTSVDLLLPDNLSLISSRPSSGKYNSGQWVLGNLRPNSVASLRLIVKVNRLKGSVPVIVRIGSQTTDSNVENNTATTLLLTGE